MFGFNYIDGGPWTHEGILAISKFMERVERLIQDVIDLNASKKEYGKEEKELDYVRNYTIHEVTKNFEVFAFNSSVARMMELVNAMNAYLKNEEVNAELLKEVVKDLVKMLAPCAPHFSEELWQILGQNNSIFNANYPVADAKKLVKDEVEIAIQINSKIVDKMVIANNLEEETVKEQVLKNDKIKEKLMGKQVVKVVVIKNRLINLIVK